MYLENNTLFNLKFPVRIFSFKRGAFMKKSFLAGLLVICFGQIGEAACETQVASVNQHMADCDASYPNWSCSTGTYQRPKMHSFVSNGALYFECRAQRCDIDYYLTFGTQGLPAGCFPEVKAGVEATNLREPIVQCGSIIQTENRVVGESIPIVGTSFSLNYFTSWVPARDRDYRLSHFIASAHNPTIFPIVGLTVLDESGATVIAQSISNASNQGITHAWNGLGSGGQSTWGSAKFGSQVSYPMGRPGSAIPMIIHYYVGSLKAKKLGLGAWVPSGWRFYDIKSGHIYNTNGTRRTVVAVLTGGQYRVAEEDGSVVYCFDSIGRLAQTKTGITGQVIKTYTYRSSDGYLSSIQEPFGRTTTFNYDVSGNFVSITAPNGVVTSVALDSNGYLASVTNPKSETYSMTYISSGMLSTFTKPNSAVSTFTYSGMGDLISDTHSGGSSLTIAEPTLNNFTTTSSMGRIRSEVLSVSGSTTTQTETMPDLSVKTSSYSAMNRSGSWKGVQFTESYSNDPRFGAQAPVPASFTETYFGSRNSSYSNTASLSTPSDPFSVVSLTQVKTMSPTQITNTYTGSTKTWLTSTILGRTATEILDTYERVVSHKVGNQTPVTFSYTNDQLTQIQQGLRTTSLGYNSTSQLLETITNPLGQVTSYSYDAAERISSVTLPDFRVMQFEYDSLGNLIRVTPQGRPDHLFSINAKELIGSYDPPELDMVNNFSTSYSYNNDKQLTQVARPDGSTLTNNYNSITGLLTSYVTPSGTFSWAYNTLKQPLALTAPDGTVMTLTYANGAESATRLTSGSTQINRYVRYQGSLSHVASDTAEGTTGSRNIAYTYDNDELLTVAGDISMSYDIPDGKLTGTGFSALTDSYTYNTFGEVTGYQAKQSGTTIYSYSLVRDDLGRVSQKTETLNGTTASIDYIYDVTGRLVQVDRNSATSATYSYDDNSNRTGGSINGTATVGTYDDQDRLTAFNVNTYAYNLNGDFQSKTDAFLSQTTTYTYDFFGNIKQVVLPAKTIAYDVDQFNRRLSRKVNGVLQVRYVFDLENRLVGEINSAGDLTRRYVYGSKSHVPDYFIDSANEKYRIFSDQIGSVRLVVKLSTGTVMQMMEHDEFGRVLQDTNPGYQPFGFAGGLYDWDTKLVRFGARDYDPETGRWTSKDPILFGGGDSNLYAYLNNDPVNGIDPSVLKTTVVITTDLGVGSHAAVHITNGGNPVLYDPSGSYLNSRRGSGDTFGGSDANLGSFAQYHRNLGSGVQLIEFNTTPGQEAAIVNNIYNRGGGGFFGCASSVSSVLGMCGINPTSFPGNLGDQARDKGGQCK